jgi:ubiquitin carboxyl-terminal hydrolase 7
MKNTHVSGTYKELFEGEYENVIQCLNVNFESARKETFNCLQLSMSNCRTIEESIRNYVAVEELTGDN